VTDIPQKVDLAVIAARAELVPEIMTDCMEASVGGAVVVSGDLQRVDERICRIRLSPWQRREPSFIGPLPWNLFSTYVDTFFFE